MDRPIRPCGERERDGAGADRRLSGPRRFVVDAMLGDLARDLRLLGYDVAYDPAAHDDALLAQARREGRLLLTKDRALAGRAGDDGLLVRSSGRDGTLREVAAALDLAPEPMRLFTRCTRCGGPLAAVRTGEVAPRLPPAVAAAQPTVRTCARCGHLYWEGSHTRALRERLEPMLRGREDETR